ncbi:TetR/AcrR family transcriptional regulator [Cryobacterium sp. AP23]
MATASKTKSDDVGILDAAALLFARYGFEQTSIQSIADAIGLSKAGLLHHFPHKIALYASVVDQSRIEMDGIRERLAGQPDGPQRDRAAIRLLVDLALIRPGLVALLLGTAVPSGTSTTPPELEATRLSLFRTFDNDIPAVSRTIRVMAALAALGVLALAAIQVDDASGWRDDIIAASFDALGHHTP